MILNKWIKTKKSVLWIVCVCSVNSVDINIIHSIRITEISREI